MDNQKYQNNLETMEKIYKAGPVTQKSISLYKWLIEEKQKDEEGEYVKIDVPELRKFFNLSEEHFRIYYLTKQMRSAIDVINFYTNSNIELVTFRKELRGSIVAYGFCNI